MAITLENDFVVEAPIEATWALLLDLGRVAQCLPGATIDPVADDEVYAGTMRVKLGPITMNYKGTAQLTEVDRAAYRAAFRVAGRETRGGGTASAIITNTLLEQGEATRVLVHTRLEVTGRPAQFGRSIMQDVAGAMLADFGAGVAALAAEDRTLGEGEPAASGANTAASLRGSEGARTADSDETAAGGADPLDPTPARRGEPGKRAGLIVVTLLVVVVLARRRGQARRQSRPGRRGLAAWNV
jgi:carbon monoxide dehydrogenase subunit G